MGDSGQSRRAALRPEDASALEALRRRIDEVDRALLDRLNERAEVVLKVGALKSATGSAVYEPSREREIVERLRSANPGPFPDAGLLPVFREIIAATRSLEAPLRVAYFGPEGTFTHQAAREHFGSLAELEGLGTIPEVFAAVERDVVRHGVVPVENTTEGVVTQTLDALPAFEGAICGELQLRISHQLLSRRGRFEGIKRVASHPQVLAQCRRWLDSHLREAERVETASTAAAAKLAMEDDSVAAIGSAIAGEVYGLATLEPAIEDRRDNTTRFLVLGRAPAEPSGQDATSVVFTIRRDEAGALHRLLEPLAARGVNLTAIHCRPIAGKPWEYYFFIDLEGHASEDRVAEALAAAAQVANSHRVLGSFPRFEAARGGARERGGRP